MIRYVTGALGHGKSLYGARSAAHALMRGKVVASNVRLVDGWEEVIGSHCYGWRRGGARGRADIMASLRRRYAFESEFATLLGARIRGRGEGRGVRIFDETHFGLNNRDFKNENQNLMLKRLSLSRKRGWDDLIIAQHASNTDVAIRRIAHSEMRVVDLQKLSYIPLLKTRLLPFHWFFAQEFPVEESAVPGVQRLGRRIGRETFFLGWWKSIYDTFEDFEFVDSLDDSGILLPRPGGNAHPNALASGERLEGAGLTLLSGPASTERAR